MNSIKNAHQKKLEGSKILVVEDNELSQLVAKEILEYAGAMVMVAEHGKQALNFLTERTFDCVLMDIQMPVMDGLEATQIIRANTSWSKMPIIALTANVDQHYRDMCLDVGMNDFLAKPINPDLLIDTVCKWL